jgi:hypothetical protein
MNGEHLVHGVELEADALTAVGDRPIDPTLPPRRALDEPAQREQEREERCRIAMPVAAPTAAYRAA